MMSLMTLNQHKNRKICHNVIIASLTSETMGKLINRIPGECLLISSLPGSALKMLQVIQQAFSKPCLVNLILKDTHLGFSMSTEPLNEPCCRETTTQRQARTLTFCI